MEFIYIYIDSIVWFDTLINEYTKEERLDKAQNYVDNVRISYYPLCTKISDYESIFTK